MRRYHRVRGGWDAAMARVTFPDGTMIEARALAARRSGRTARPEFGLYAYGRAVRRPTRIGRTVNRVTGRALHGGSWRCPWDSAWIHWPDLGVPADGAVAATAIVEAFRRAQAGESVEVACFGGAGRTGTILACMAVLAGVPGDQAVAWVRANHSPRAVERDVQRRWVGWFAARQRPGPDSDRVQGPADRPPAQQGEQNGERASMPRDGA
jgi:hypothetical protein